MKKNLLTILLFGLVLAGAPFTQAVSQSKSDWREILVRVSELEGQVEALKRDAKNAGTGDLDPGQRALLADMEVRIGQLETEIRKLTGLFEEITYRQGRIEKDLDLFKRDVELRFQDLGTAGTMEAMTAKPAPKKDMTEEEPTRTAVAEMPEVSLPAGTVQEQYDFAFAYLRRGDFPGAEAAFLAFLGAHPDHTLAGNAQYWLGETYYVRKDYPEAAAAFLKGFQTYGDGAKGADSLLKLGMSLSSMNQNEQACSAFEELLSRYSEAGEPILTQARAQQGRLKCQ